jgi:hypothetical protein
MNPIEAPAFRDHARYITIRKYLRHFPVIFVNRAFAATSMEV